MYGRSAWWYSQIEVYIEVFKTSKDQKWHHVLIVLLVYCVQMGRLHSSGTLIFSMKKAGLGDNIVSEGANRIF